MEQYIYRIRPTRLGMLTQGPTDDEARIVGEHFTYLQALADAGRLFMAGRTTTTDESCFGIAIFMAATDLDAQAVLAQDPAVVQGVMRGEVFPFRVALWAGNPMSAQQGTRAVGRGDAAGPAPASTPGTPSEGRPGTCARMGHGI